MFLPPVRTVAPAELPLTLAECKDHLHVEHSEDDALIAGYLSAAVDALDGWSGELGRCLVTQTWRQDFACFPAGRDLRLAFPDVQSVAVAYSDGDDAEQTLAGTVYRLLPTTLGASLFLKTGQAWPSTYDREDAVRVTMTCGYGAASDVPEKLRQALKMTVADWYARRETVITGAIVSQLPLPVSAQRLIRQARRVGF